MRNRIEGERTAGAECVADSKEAGVHQPHDVARVGFLNRFSVTAEESVRSRHPDLAVQPRMMNHHVLLEATRYNAEECHPIAMLRVHVRLDLEHKAREFVVRRPHEPLRAHARARRRREMKEPVQEWFDAEVRQRAPERPRELAGEEAVAIELGAGAGQQGNLFLQRTISLSQCLRQARVRERLHPHRSPALVMQRPLKDSTWGS